MLAVVFPVLVVCSLALVCEDIISLVFDVTQTGRVYRRELRQELYYLERYGSSADGVEKAGGLLRYLYRIKGKISYVLAIDPENEEFRSRTKWINEWIRQVELEQWLLERKDWY